MKIVGFIGSPRKKGNTTTIVNEVLRGAQEAGAETKVFNLNQLSIRGCRDVTSARRRRESVSRKTTWHRFMMRYTAPMPLSSVHPSIGSK